MVYKRLLAYARPHAWQMLLGLLCTALGSAATIAYFKVAESLVSAVQGKSVNLLFATLAGFALLNLVKNAATYAGSYTIAAVGQQIVARVRAELFRRIESLPLQVFDRWRGGELMSRFSNDVNFMVQGVNSAPQFVGAVLTLAGSIVAMIVVNWHLLLVLLAVAPFVSFAVSRFSSVLRGVTGTSLARVADVNSVLQESIDSMRVIKAFGREPYELARFTNSNDAYLGASLKMSQIALTQTPVVDVIVSLGLAILAGYSFYEVVTGRLTMQQWAAFFTLAMVSGNPVNQISNYVSDLNKAIIGARRAFEVLDLPVEASDAPSALPLLDVRGQIEFANVHFSYDGQTDVLKGVTTRVAPGDVVALVGPSGSGKTTIVNLIPRFYAPTSGAIYVDGYDIEHVTLASLRASIAIVPQDPQLFSDTIEQNIRYGRLNATKAEVRDAARQANAHDFITRFPDGYDTRVGARGMRLSGGERQRIAIARAILRAPRILILDEATSSLDAESEALINEALERLLVGRTTFIIAHRLSTIRRATSILVIVDGQVAEQGTHADLLARNGVYTRLHAASAMGAAGARS
ncbi:MAG TPA: ABC transporter ATP-binding protein [Candidatus Eremiobacteraceae bacterium]|nr:ABC transporter ATP-binding protein [Candidatus Eremiobacteraceae bacterium]